MRWQMEQISPKCRGWFEVELVTWLYLFGNQMNYIDKKLTGNTVGFGSIGPWFKFRGGGEFPLSFFIYNLMIAISL